MKLNVWGLGFMQNKLRDLVLRGEIAEPIAERLIALLRQEQLRALGKVVPVSPAPPPPAAEVPDMPPAPAAPVLQPAVAAAATVPPIASPRGPSAFDAALAGPNLLLYLGAFLIAVSGLLLVAITPEDLSAQLKVLLGVGGTFAFLAAGIALHPNETVRPAARTFLLLGAVLIPLDVWSIGTQALDAEHSARTHLLLVGSVLSAALYANLAVRGYGDHFVLLTGIALVGMAEGTAQSFALPPSWHAVPHFALATALIVAGRSDRAVLAPFGRSTPQLVAWVEGYAFLVIAAFLTLRVPSLTIDVPSLAAASVFAAFARPRGAADRAVLWSWVACAAGALAVFGLLPRDAPAVARVSVLLAIAFALWIAPLTVPTARWVLVPGRAIGWISALAALYVGLTSEPGVRALALAGVTVPLAYVAWSSERAPRARVRPSLIGALVGGYLLWISILQIAGALPARITADGLPALAWATSAVFAALWPAVLWLVPRSDPWTGELRGASHVAAAVAVALMFDPPQRPVSRLDDVLAVGPRFGALLAGLAALYAAGIRERRLPESAALAIALGSAASVGALEAVMGGLTAWAILLPGMVGAIALTSIPFGPWPSPISVRVGAIAAILVGLAVHALYRVAHVSGPEIVAALVIVVVAVGTAYLLPQAERGYRWTLGATLTLVAFLVARSATDRLAYDPQVAALPFVIVLAAPGVALAVTRRRMSDDARALLLSGALVASMAAALSLGRYGPVWSPAVAAVEIALLALLAVRVRDQGISGAPVMLAALSAETAMRHLHVTDMLVQGVVYGLAVIASARYLAHPALEVERVTVRALYAIGVGLLTLPAMVRSAGPDGWWAVAYLAALSAVLITAAVRLRQHALGVIGSVLALTGVVAGLYQTRIVETLVYTTAVGFNLTGLGLYLGRVHLMPQVVTRDLLSLIRWSGALLLLVPAVVRSWDGPQYGVVFFVLFGLVLSGGLLLRQRSMLAAAVGALGLEALWVVTTVARLLPFWMLFGIAGLVLLTVGTVLVFRRDLLERAQTGLQAKWDLAE